MSSFWLTFPSIKCQEIKNNDGQIFLKLKCLKCVISKQMNRIDDDIFIWSIVQIIFSQDKVVLVFKALGQ